MNAALRMLKTGDFNPHFFNYPGLLIYANLAGAVAHYFQLMGEPPGSERHLGTLDALEIPEPGGFIWASSHPSFYGQGRALTVLLGTAGIVAAFLLANALRGPRAGLVAAAIVACLHLHVIHSTFIATDVPLATLAMLSVWLAVRHVRDVDIGSLAGAAVVAGLATATKYNGGVVLAAVLLAAAMRGGPWSRAARLGMAAAIAAATFLCFNPYVVLDFATFIRQAGFEVYHYKVLGHTDATSEPGWDHLRYQARMMASSLGWPLLAFSVLGLGLSLRHPRASVVALSFPLLYVGYMVQQRANFHRNMLAVYPFLAVGAGIAADLLAPAAARAAGRSLSLRRAAAAPTGLGSLVLVLLAAAWLRTDVTLEEARTTGTARDTRRQAVDTVNELLRNAGPGKRVGVARELHVHPLDTGRLAADWGTFTQTDADATTRFDYLLATSLQGLEGREARAHAAVFQGATEVSRIEGHRPFLDRPIVNPVVSILRPVAGRRPSIRTVVPARLSGTQRTGFHPGGIHTDGRARLTGLRLELAPGSRRLVLETGTLRRHKEREASAPAVSLDGGAPLPLVDATLSTFVFELPPDKTRVDDVAIDSPAKPRAGFPGPVGIDVVELRFE